MSVYGKGANVEVLVPKSKRRAASQPRKVAQHANAGRGQRRRAFPLPDHPTVIAAAARALAAHTDTDDQLRVLRRFADRLEATS